jgi:predicted anti-sigma-YlaC factor YlaD
MLRTAIPLLGLLTFGCASMQRLAINQVSNALAKQGEVFSSDDDPELVGDAIPFSLKLIESLLAENPRHSGLLLAATSGFTQYAFGWIQESAAEIEKDDPAKAAHQQDRARRLYFRARNYGLRGFEVAHSGFERALRSDPRSAVRLLDRHDVPMLYWTAASWGLAISLSKDQPDVVADLPIVEAMIDRALELDESFDSGAIHSFLITYELNRQGAEGDAVARSRKHLERAVELSGGMRSSPYVTFAESASVQTQNRAEFESLLGQALAINPDAKPKWRLENRISQKHGQWLLAHADELFVADSEGEKK